MTNEAEIYLRLSVATVGAAMFGFCAATFWFSAGRLFQQGSPESSNAERPIISFDDGSDVILDGWSGGADPDGALSHLTLRFRAADGTETLRSYSADDNARS